MTWMPCRASQPPNHPAWPYTSTRAIPTTTGETATGRSIAASRSAAPGKRRRANISAAITPNTALSGTAIRATMRVSTSAWTNPDVLAPSGLARFRHAVTNPDAKAR